MIEDEIRSLFHLLSVSCRENAYVCTLGGGPGINYIVLRSS